MKLYGTYYEVGTVEKKRKKKLTATAKEEKGSKKSVWELKTTEPYETIHAEERSLQVAYS